MVEHRPVLVEEVTHFLAQGPGLYLDATTGGGGHAARLLDALPAEARLLALDRDPAALERARVRLAPYGDRVLLMHRPFDQLGEVLSSERLGSLAGALFDLGLSSLQLGDADRGFAFSREGTLDLRFDPTAGAPAHRLLGTASAETLARWFAEYGELPQSHRLARSIVEFRASHPIHTTGDLRRAVARVWGDTPHPRRLAQLFQALRIAVNDELATVERGLDAAIEALAPGGVLAVISYHSLEDRLVKRILRGPLPARREAQLGAPRPDQRLEPVTRKAIVPSPSEVAQNPRARSAKLRVARRIAA
jgi:16S rRNA (cytosine1402-N4)-methyltransferase